MSATQVKARLRPFGFSFEKSLKDLVDGIRANNGDPDKLTAFLESSLQECKTELKTTDLELKSTALLKLAYLEMYGFDMSWCSFQVLEVMSSPKFQHKRIGYLAAIQILQRGNNDDALMLMTNLLKKDLSSYNFVETGMAISGIASLVTTELAQDICNDMVKMLNHSKPFIRKKAVLAMYKIFLKFPEALRANFDRIVDKLDDSDPSVVSATVNVICELAHKNPKNYVDLAPRLFGMMKDSSNNWMTIRLLKLFAPLCIIEPRLKFKLLPELVQLIKDTKALSLVYECINCILNGDMLGPNDTNVAKLIIAHLLTFFESQDQNLKYVGLLAFIKTCKIHDNLIRKHDKVLLSCIFDDDITIREKSLEILSALVTEQNIVNIVTRLLIQLIPVEEQGEKLNEINKSFIDDDSNPENFYTATFQQPIMVNDKYKLDVIEKIIEICSIDNYSNIPNFRWYLGVLTDIIRLNIDNKIPEVDRLISEQFVDISIKVPSIRSTVVSTCIELIKDCSREAAFTSLANGLKQFIWIIGEYYIDYMNSNPDNSDDDEDDEYETETDTTEEKITAPAIVSIVASLPGLFGLADSNPATDDTISVFIQALAKLFSKYCLTLGNEWADDDLESASQLANALVLWLEPFKTSVNYEVQERAISFGELLKLVLDSLKQESETLIQGETKAPPHFLSSGYSQLFNNYQIKPISSAVQSRIQVPEDLDLDVAINENAMGEFMAILQQINEKEIQEYEENILMDETFSEGEHQFSESDSETEDLKKKERLERQKDDPFYLSQDTKDTNSHLSETPGAEVKTKTKKKPHKPKKIRKEKVLILDEETADDTSPVAVTRKKKDSLSRTRNRKSGKKFLVDSNLDNFDLAGSEEVHNKIDEYDVEFEVEKLRKELEISAAVSSSQPEVAVKPKKPNKKKTVKEETPDEVVVTVKKPKKKKKATKKVAVIHEDL